MARRVRMGANLKPSCHGPARPGHLVATTLVSGFSVLHEVLPRKGIARTSAGYDSGIAMLAPMGLDPAIRLP